MSGKIRKRPTPPAYVMRTIEGVPLHFLSNPEDPNSPLIEEKFTLQAKSYTVSGYVRLMEELREMEFAGEDHVQCEVLAQSITSIIDSEGNALTDENGEPAQLTAGFFIGLLDEDREAIRAAIKADANPPKQTSAPGPSGSSPEASAA
jgi:hypothetical protein